MDPAPSSAHGPRVRLNDLPSEPAPPADPRSDEVPPGGAAGRYEVQGEIARGGVGAVLSARDADLGRDVAIKVLLSAHQGSPDVERRFVEEAQIGGQLQHPGIVPVYELGTLADRRPFIAMKLVRGRTLAELLAGRPDPAHDRRRFLAIFEQVCQTVAYAHARGVIHRDLKPSNVMVGAFGEVQVMDWGLAKVLGAPDTDAPGAAAPAPDARADLSMAGSVLGTPAYMPPEQARGDVASLDRRSDVFSLGAILCEVLTGRPPYEGETAAETCLHAARGALDGAWARLDASGADPDLVRIPRGALAPRPEDRPADAGALAAQVQAHLASVEERARAAERDAAAARARAASERRARRLTVGLAGSIVLALAAGGGGWAWVQRERRNRAEEAGRAVAGALRDAERLQARARRTNDPGHWTEARVAVEQAHGLARASRLAPADRERAESLAAELLAEEQAASGDAARAAADRRMVERLEAIRLELGDAMDWAETGRRFDEAFREYGLDIAALDDETAVARVRASPIVNSLVVGLWFWGISYNRQQANTGVRHLAIGRRADPDPWRQQLWAAFDRGPRGLLAFHATCDPATIEPINLELLTLLLNERGEVERAIETLYVAQHRHPDQFWITFHLARMLMESERGTPAERARLFSAALALRPNSALVRGMLGRALHEGGDLPAALQAYDEALRLRPGLTVALNGRGLLRREMRDPGGAVADLREAVRQAPWNALPREHLIDALFSMGDGEGAVAEAREAVRATGSSLASVLALGEALHEVGDREGAVECFRQAAGLPGSRSRAALRLASALQETGRCEAALETLKGATPAETAPAAVRRAHAEAVLAAKRLVRMEERLPLLIRGAASPTDPREWIDAARIMGGRGDAFLSNVFWGLAFSLKPELAHDLDAGYRREAARAAARAGCCPKPGGAKGNPMLLRGQALAWLKADLEAWGERIARGGDDARRARRAIQCARYHRDFAEVRGEAAIVRMPEPEREAWRELWKRAEALVAE